jgi:hypothetical protein
MAQQLSTNTYGTAKWIVSSTLSNGTHTTIAGALTSASSGDTIFIRPGTYTEDLTLKAGVNLCAYEADALTPNVTISGNATATFAGTCSLSGIRLSTNSTSLLTISGSNATIVYLKDCFLAISQTPAITYSSSSASSRLYLQNCRGDISVVNKALVSFTSAGQMILDDTIITNSGASTLPPTITGGLFRATRCSFFFETYVSTGGTGVFEHCTIDTSAQNNYAFVIDDGVATLSHCKLSSGTQIAALIAGGTLTISQCVVDSTNTNPLSGSGATINLSGITYSNTGFASNATTVTGRVFDCGICVTPKQPSFCAYTSGALTNVTGDGTSYTVVFGTERYDVGSNYNNSTGIFTAPYTGKYLFTTTIQPEQIDATQSDYIYNLQTSNNTYNMLRSNQGVIRLNTSYTAINGAVMADMDAADTAQVTIAISQIGGKTVDFSSSSTYDWFSGILIM